MIAVGLMSGTSLDGVDAALVAIRPDGSSYDVRLLDFATEPFEADLGKRLRAALPPNAGSAQQLAELHRALGKAFGRAARSIAGAKRTDYVASHGQTIFHDGSRGVTLQLGDPFAIRDAVRATVCYDFRTADCVAGGQGAPLVPYADALLFASASEDRVAVNIGGIANITILERGASPQTVIAFDTGPGNMLIDLFVRDRTGGAAGFDRDGSYALAGAVDVRALEALRADDYFALPPPKSTGRERFGLEFLKRHAPVLDALSLEDGAATLTALTASTLGDAIQRFAPARAKILVSGGGVRNRAILQGLRERLRGCSVEPSDAMNVDADAKEAIAFAILGYETLRGRAANASRATGAAAPVQLGAIAPFELPALLRKVEIECRA